MLKQCFKYLSFLIIFSALVACSSAPKKEPIVIEKAPTNQLPVLTEQEKASYQDAISLLAEGKYSQAETLFNKLVDKHPRLTGAYVNLGVIKKNEQQIEQAKTYFAKALEINPNFIDALLQQALVLQDSGEFKEAETLLRRAEALQSDHPLVNYNLGVLYELYLQEYDLAIKHYERYVTLSKADDVATVKRWIMLLERK